MKILKPLKKRKIFYKKIMGFDIETHGNKNEFVIACFYSEDLRKVCFSKEEVIKFLKNNKLRQYNIYATNLGFDFLGSLYEHSDRWTICERQGTIYNFKWYQSKTEKGLENPVNFYDTLRIFPASVEKLGKLLNLPKIKHPKCFGEKPKTDNDMIELINYCMNDAKISQQFIKKIVQPFCEKYNVEIKSTIGSISLQVFRRNHLKQALFQEPEINREISFKSYYGGRTETFQRGKFENVYCFDVNSLYPSVMRKAYPNPNKSRYHEFGSEYNINKYEGVSLVDVYVPENIYIPPLPLKQEGKLIFPTGYFSGHYNHNELRNALKFGCKIINVHQQLIYPETTNFFETFVNNHYEERLKLQNENNPLQVMEKNVMNNLYGKFAFNYKKTSSIIPSHKLDFKKHVINAEFIEPLLEGKFYSIESKNIYAPLYSFPILSSYITSEARILMYKYLSDKRLQHKIISTDTDSIFIKNYQGEIEESKQLGKMKLEDGYPIKYGYFVRPKMYLTHKPKCKGVKFQTNAKESFMDILNGQEIVQERFIKFRTAIRSKDSYKFGKLTPNQIIQITKKLDLEDTKRIWPDKFNFHSEQISEPINLQQKINRQVETYHNN